MSDLHADAVDVLTRARLAGQEQLRRRFLEHLRVHPNGLSRGCFPAHLTTSTAVLSADRDRVLLTLHAKARRWFQLGGHTEPGDRSLLDSAARETLEESGLAGLDWHPEPVHLDAHQVDFCHPQGAVVHLDVRFVAIAPEGVDPLASAESEELRWWPVDRLPTDEPSLLALVRAARGHANVAPGADEALARLHRHIRMPGGAPSAD